MLALGAAVGLAFLMNQLKPTFIGNRSVTEVLGIPVLASVSLLQSPAEKRAERNDRRTLQAAVTLLLVSFTVVTLFSETGSNLLRQLTTGLS